MSFTELSSASITSKVARYSRRILPRDLAVPILRGELRGTKWIIESQRHACWLGIYEKALQAVVAREVKPGETAILTVGYVRAGTKNNIIPDDAELGLTVRSYKADVRKQLLAAITRIANGEAESAGAPRPPKVDRYESTDAVYNDPGLAHRLQAVLESALGKQNVDTPEPILASEDFSAYIAQCIPSFYFNLGGADPAAFAKARASGERLPSNHSPLFAPDVDPALHTGIEAEVAILRNLLNGSKEDLKKSISGQ